MQASSLLGVLAMLHVCVTGCVEAAQEFPSSANTTTVQPPLNQTTTSLPFSFQYYCKDYSFTPSSVCGNYISGMVYYYGNATDLIKIDANSEQVFQYLYRAVSLVRNSEDKLGTARTLFHLLGLMGRSLNMKIPSDKILKQIINVVTHPSFDVCLNHSQNFLCKQYFPSCVQSMFYKNVWIEETPCQEMCYYIINKKCKREKALYDLLLDYGFLHYSALKCDWLQSYYSSRSQCFMSTDTLNFLKTSDKEKIRIILNKVSTKKTNLVHEKKITTTPYSKSKVSSTTTTTRASDGNNSDALLDRLCPKYDTVLPDGECIDYMKETRIFQIKKKALENNIALRVFYNEFSIYIGYFLRRSGPAYSLGKCGEKPEVRKLLNVIVLPSSEEFSLCLNASKKFACQTYHPTCLYSNSSGKIKVQISPPCRRPCEEYEPCKISLAFMRRLNDLVALCPGYHWNILLFAFPSCGEYLQHNQSVIERCQMLHPQATTEELQYTTHCYRGAGINYNGTLSVTLSGRRCIPWKTRSYLNPEVYPNLVRNYCRNPQGYGDRPWCYVNMTGDEWEDCDVVKCSDYYVEEIPVSKLSLVNIIVIILVVVAVVSLLVFLVHCVRKKAAKKVENVTPVEAYSELEVTQLAIKESLPTTGHAEQSSSFTGNPTSVE